MRLLLLLALLIALSTTAPSQPRLFLTPGEQMRIDLSKSSIMDDGEALLVHLHMNNDNGAPEGVLPWDFRRWWHVGIEGLDAERENLLRVEIHNAGYRDRHPPVWSLGGAPYERMPESARTEFTDGVHRFSITVPRGTGSLRMAKYFPYTFADFAAFREGLKAREHTREEVIGQSVEGRVIYMYTITDRTVPDEGKERVWIHAAVHPAETPANFMIEGIAAQVLSDTPEGAALRRSLIFNLVPMPNPDGVYHGNYRTNARSVNLELQWAPEVETLEPEAQAFRTQIDTFMGTAEQPGANPIRMLLNLHAAHGGNAGPFHFLHEPDYNTSGRGVVPEVREIEDRWVRLLGARSPWAAKAHNPGSGLQGRAYVEAYLHDNFSIKPQWEPVMAVTIEGVYWDGPTPGVGNTPRDYRRFGRDIALAIGDYFDVYTEPAQ